jgi:hypothetical protein
MSKKTVFITFVSTIILVILVGLLSFWIWSNQPSADVVTPPVPPNPSNAPTDRPPVPTSAQLAGDTLDDGIVNALDINALVAHWKEQNADYNLVDNPDEAKYTINVLDLSQTIKYWKCLETRTDKDCPYLSTTSSTSSTSSIPTPPVPESP